MEAARQAQSDFLAPIFQMSVVDLQQSPCIAAS
jgi:hypothetical protein